MRFNANKQKFSRHKEGDWEVRDIPWGEEAPWGNTWAINEEKTHYSRLLQEYVDPAELYLASERRTLRVGQITGGWGWQTNGHKRRTGN